MAYGDIFELLCIFFKLDAGSYTENAGGKKSLDHLFIFDEKNKNIDLAPDIKKRIDLIWIACCVFLRIDHVQLKERNE